MPRIRQITPGVTRLKRKKRVAAYARVSEECEVLLHSLSAKVGAFQRISNGLPESGLSKVSQTVTKHPTAMNGTERCSASSPNRARW